MISDTLRNHTRQALEQATIKISTSSGFKGTGFFISPDGYILTAWHCIAEIIPMPFSTISVETIDGKNFTAQLDKDKSIEESDIAVIKIAHHTDNSAPLGFVSEAHKDDEVIAVGYPAAHIDADRSMAVYRGTIAQLVGDKIAIVNAIQGQQCH